MKKILFFLFIFIFLAVSLYSHNSNNIVVGTLLPNKKNFNDIVDGMKKNLPNIKIVNLFEKREDVTLIISYETFFNKSITFHKPIFLLIDSIEEKSKYNSPLIKQYIILTASIKSQIKNALNLLEKGKKLSVVVHNRYILNLLKNFRTKNLKIFYVKKIGEVPYKIDKALKETDALLAIPDKTVFNYFSIQFIFKKAILMGKYIIGYSEDMLDLGAYAVVVPNFISEGCILCKSILYFIKKKNVFKKIVYPSDVKVIKNKNIVENKESPDFS